MLAPGQHLVHLDPPPTHTHHSVSTGTLYKLICPAASSSSQSKPETNWLHPSSPRLFALCNIQGGVTVTVGWQTPNLLSDITGL